MKLLTLHPVTEDQTIAACGLCHQITRTPGEGEGHLQAAHPRRYALAKERHGRSA